MAVAFLQNEEEKAILSHVYKTLFPFFSIKTVSF